MKNIFFIKIKYFLEYLLIFLIHNILYVLPINFSSNIGGFLFRLIGPFTKQNYVAKKNYLKIFPLAKKMEVAEAINNSWSNSGKTFAELLILPRIIKNHKNIVKIEGEQYLENIKKNKDQAIFIGIHESNWELLIPIIDRLGISLGAIYRHINNPYINKLIVNLRNKSLKSKKSFYTPKGKESAKDIINALKMNLSAIMLIDQKDSSGEYIEFFNTKVKTQIGFLKLARKYKIKIIPVHNIRDKKNNFTIKFYKPFEIHFNELNNSEQMKKIHEIIEEWIKENPSNWFLQHNRFN